MSELFKSKYIIRDLWIALLEAECKKDRKSARKIEKELLKAELKSKSEDK